MIDVSLGALLSFRFFKCVLIASMLFLNSCSTVGSTVRSLKSLWPFGSSDSGRSDSDASTSSKLEELDQELTSSEKVEEKELEELSRKDAVKVDGEFEEGPVTLRVIRAIEKAQNYFSRGLYTLSKEKFEALRQVDSSPTYREYIQIKLADCSFFKGEYETAANEYNAFIDAHPDSPIVPYALFNGGQALQISSPGAGRDPSTLYRAQELFSKLVRQYPTSGYSRLALEHFINDENKLKAHREKIIGFYDNLDLSTALRARMDSTHLEEKNSDSSVSEMQQLLAQKSAPIIHTLNRSNISASKR